MIKITEQKKERQCMRCPHCHHLFYRHKVIKYSPEIMKSLKYNEKYILCPRCRRRSFVFKMEELYTVFD